MTITKKITGAIVAIAFVLTAVLTFAFKAGTDKNANKFVGEKWFDYTSSSTLPADYNTFSNYLIAGDGSEEPDCATGSYIRCAVQAKPLAGNPSQPDLTTVIATRTRAR